MDEKKKYYDDSHKFKNENTHKIEEVKKIEFKLKTNKLSNSPNKYFDGDNKDDLSSKPVKICVDNTKENYVIKKKPESLKSDHSEPKTSESSKHSKSYEDKDSYDTGETEHIKKYRSDADKKNSYSKRIENRRQDSKIDRRIRNKDRPAIEIYRPGMGRLSKLKAESDSGEPETKSSSAK